MIDLEPTATWRRALAGTIAPAPLLDGTRVVARASTELAAVDAADGARLWGHRVDPLNGDGRTLVAFGDLYITDRSGDRSTALVAVHPASGVVWEVDVGCRVGIGGLAVSGGRLLCVGNSAGRTGVFHALDPAGKTLVSRPMPWGADRVVVLGRQAIIANRSGRSGAAPGLYALDLDGAGERPLVEDAVHSAVVTARGLVLANRAAGGQVSLQLRTPPSLEIAWRAPSPCAALAADETEVACIDDTDLGVIPMARSLADGSARWTGAPLPGQPEQAFLAGEYAAYMLPRGLFIHRRADGAQVGLVEGGRSALSWRGRLIVHRLDTLLSLQPEPNAKGG